MTESFQIFQYNWLFRGLCRTVIFNLRPLEEVDCLCREHHTAAHRFNSRPLEEVDSSWTQIYTADYVSIHDLSKRSTSVYIAWIWAGSVSIHDLSKRSTGLSHIAVKSYWRFNSRPLEEVDRHDLQSRKSDTSFNSRPLEEVDFCPCWAGCRCLVSIHDLSKRST